MQIVNTKQSNVSNVAHVGDVRDGVCSFYTNVYSNVYSVLYTCPSPLQEGGLL